MDKRFDDDDLERLFYEPDFTGGRPVAIVKAFRKVVGAIENATDERDFRQMRSLNFEKLKGAREGEWSMRLNDQFRLIVTIETGNPKNTIVIKSIEDYH